MGYRRVHVRKEPSGPPIPPDKVDLAAEVTILHRSGVTHSEIMRRTGIGRPTVWEYIRAGSEQRPVEAAILRLQTRPPQPDTPKPPHGLRGRVKPDTLARLEAVAARSPEWVIWSTRSDAIAVRTSAEASGIEGFQVRTVIVPDGTRRVAVALNPKHEPPNLVKPRAPRGSRKVRIRAVAPLIPHLPPVHFPYGTDRLPPPSRAEPSRAELDSLIGRVVCPGCAHPVDSPGESRRQALTRHAKTREFCSAVLRRHDRVG